MRETEILVTKAAYDALKYEIAALKAERDEAREIIKKLLSDLGCTCGGFDCGPCEWCVTVKRTEAFLERGKE